MIDGLPGTPFEDEVLVHRLRWTSERVEESAFLAGPARLAKRLMILASLHGRSTSIGRLELRKHS